MGVTSSMSSAQEVYLESISMRISNPESSFALNVWVSRCEGFCWVPARFRYWLWKTHTSYLKKFARRVARNVSMPASLSLQFDWLGNRLQCSFAWSGVVLSLSVYSPTLLYITMFAYYYHLACRNLVSSATQEELMLRRPGQQKQSQSDNITLLSGERLKIISGILIFPSSPALFAATSIWNWQYTRENRECPKPPAMPR